MSPTLKHTLAATTLLLGLTSSALANDHGGGGAAAMETLKFTTNLGNPAVDGNYLQLEVALETGSPEAGAAVGKLRPRIQHQLILLLSSQTAAVLKTLKGKQDLQHDIRDIANKVIDEDDHTGVKEVLFTNFIIQ